MKKLFYLLLSVVASVGTTRASIINGTCGENLTWSLNTEDSTLVISGIGDMTNWSNYDSPWSTYSSIVKIVRISPGITSIGEKAFYGCHELSHIFFADGILEIGASAFFSCRSLDEVRIPNSVTKIGDYAFRYCRTLSSIELSHSLSEIGSSVFADCDSLRTIEIPEGVNTLGYRAFFRSSNLETIKLPTTLKSIQQGCFTECKSLQALELPDSLRSIGKFGMSNCWALTHVTIPRDMYSFGSQPFYQCSNLVSIKWNAKSFGYSNLSSTTNMQPFYEVRSQITSFEFGEDVDSIPPYLCNSMSSLSKITIPQNVKFIDNRAFAFCYGLTSISCLSMIPPVADSLAFEGVSRSIPLYVPIESYDAYQNAKVWNEFLLSPITAQNIETTEVQTIALETSVNISWPSVPGTDTYELVIRNKNDNMICTLIFNGEGQLLSFQAPTRGNAPRKMPTTGFSFTITGLEPGTQYNYSIIAKNESGATLSTKTGTFATNVLEALDQITNEKCQMTNKVLRDGQIFILRGDKTYTVTGQEVK